MSNSNPLRAGFGWGLVSWVVVALVVYAAYVVGKGSGRRQCNDVVIGAEP